MFQDKKESGEIGTNVKVDVNVTNIVKYVCITGAFIVAIIFTTKCIGKCITAK